MRFRLHRIKWAIEIVENTSGLGKRYVLKKYNRWVLIETYPYDRLDEIKIRGFRIRDIRWS